MSDEWANEQIAKLAINGRLRTTNATVYGVPMDPENIEHVYAMLEAIAIAPMRPNK